MKNILVLLLIGFFWWSPPLVLDEVQTLVVKYAFMVFFALFDSRWFDFQIMVYTFLDVNIPNILNIYFEGGNLLKPIGREFYLLSQWWVMFVFFITRNQQYVLEYMYCYPNFSVAKKYFISTFWFFSSLWYPYLIIGVRMVEPVFLLICIAELLCVYLYIKRWWKGIPLKDVNILGFFAAKEEGVEYEKVPNLPFYLVGEPWPPGRIFGEVCASLTFSGIAFSVLYIKFTTNPSYFGKWCLDYLPYNTLDYVNSTFLYLIASILCLLFWLLPIHPAIMAKFTVIWLNFVKWLRFVWQK